MNIQQEPFSHYFHQWLYGDKGYYSNYKAIGKEGDFFTAVSTSKFFGGAIGKRVVDVITQGFLPNNTTIVEIGAHHGYLLADMIEFIYTLQPELIKTLKFAIVERYDHLQYKQQEYFKKSFGDVIELVHYKDIREVQLQSAFIVANEIFDAFPCDLVYTNKEGVLQQGIVENHTIHFVENTDPFIKQYCETYQVSKGEVARGYEEFASLMCHNIEKFEFVTFDYGEKYPRNDFSCRIYEKHQVFPIFDEKIQLKTLFQQSDITYDVNFSHLIDSFKKAGAKNLSFTTQLKALVGFGIIELLEILYQNVDEEIYLKEANKVKTLLNPIGMGDRFKMASFQKGE